MRCRADAIGHSQLSEGRAGAKKKVGADGIQIHIHRAGGDGGFIGQGLALARSPDLVIE